jgi:predicted Zn-dependent protease
MARLRFLLLAALVCAAALVACRHEDPYQMKKEYQALQAAQLRPAQLEHGQGGEWHALRTMRVRLYADPALIKKGGVRSEFEDRLAHANHVLEAGVRLRLTLESVRDLPAQAPASDTGVLLSALQRLDDAKDVDFVVALVAASPVVTLSFHDLGRANVLGKHVVVRTMDDAAELRALEGFDTLSADERSKLYQQRKRHKEMSVLLHEIGHALGALHTRDNYDLMHPSYDNHMQGFAPANLELMRYVVAERMAAEDARDPAALLQRITDYLKRSDFPGWVEEERKSYLVELGQALQQGRAPPASSAAAQASEPAAAPAEPQEDLSALSEPDRARYAEIDRGVQEERWHDVYAIISSLAKAYPDSFVVQQKACRIGMRLGLGFRDLKPLCDRMTALSMQPGGQ